MLSESKVRNELYFLKNDVKTDTNEEEIARLNQIVALEKVLEIKDGE